MRECVRVCVSEMVESGREGEKRVPVENQFKSVFIPFQLGMFFSNDG